MRKYNGSLYSDHILMKSLKFYSKTFEKMNV